MKNTINFAAMVLAAAFAGALSLHAAAAVTSKQAAGKSGAQFTQSYTWYDGNREQRVWLNPQAVAEFNPGKFSTREARSADGAAQLLPMKRKQRGVRMWRMNNIEGKAVHGLATRNPAGKYSPVFHDGASSSDHMRALPGNIIVYLNPTWDAATVNSWIKKRNLEVAEKLEMGPNIYVIKTAPGLEALTTANEIYLSGEVAAAFPNWWEEVSTR
ncbi:MAG: hypothetical protein Q7U91_09950 [Sideroxyarcus sp.]|nr:hypothetical protein [Sideroxyarcus sp.]